MKGINNMDKNRRKELQEEFKQLKTYMGVIQITNLVNGKIYITAYPNLKNQWLTIQGQLVMGTHANHQLQKDWNEYGAEAFNYEIIEEKETSEISDVPWEVKQMEKAWLEKLQPYGDRGYNLLKKWPSTLCDRVGYL
jgi:hypothetical protein